MPPIILFGSTSRFYLIFHLALEKENQYKQIPRVDQMTVHFQLDGNIINIDSEEAKIQLGILDPSFIVEDNTDETEDDQQVHI